MKIRIRGNSVRLRLTQSEVNQVNRDGVVTAETLFPNRRTFRYSLDGSATLDAVSAIFDDDGIRVLLPKPVAQKWAASDQVSIEGEQLLDDGETLRLLIEKDFACIKPRPGEEESDMYANPDAGKEKC